MFCHTSQQFLLNEEAIFTLCYYFFLRMKLIFLIQIDN